MSDANYYTLFERSPLPMWVYDVKTFRYLDVNIAATNHYGFSKEEFLSKTIYDLTPKDDHAEVENIIDENARTGRFYKNTLRHLKKNGKVIIVEVESNSIVFNDVEARIVLAHDITKRVEEEHWSKLLESVVINTTDGVLITDATSNPGPTIIYVNDALVRMSGYSKAELIGRQPDIFYGNQLAQEGLKIIDEALSNKVPCNVELVNFRKDGQVYDVSINICPVSDSMGKVTHWTSIQRDITENRSYVKAIEDQNKKLTDIAWMHAHKVRAPLTRIMSLVDLLKNHASVNDIEVLHNYLAISASELDDVISNITNNEKKANVAVNEHSFQLFMDELPGLCWIAAEDGVLKYANKCFFDTLHLPPTIIGKTLKEIFGKDIASNARKNNHDVLASGKNKEFYQSLRDEAGHLQHYKTYKFPFKDKSGQGNMVGAIAFNVTKSIKLEEELYQSEAQFKQAFEHSLIGMALISPKGKWKRVNKSLCNMLGYTAAEMKRLTIQELTHPNDLMKSIAVLGDLASGRIEEMKYEKRYLHKDGSAIWVVIAATMLYDSVGTPLHYVSQIEDITKRKEIENDLLLSEKKYRTIFENVQDVFYQTDKEGIVTEISPSIAQHSGYLRTEIIGKSVDNFYYYTQDRERIVEQIRIKGFVIDFEVRLKTKDEELRYASVNARLIIENGIITGTEGSMRDVTTRKFHENALQALNTELTASNEQKNKLFSIIGHDLRNPISGSLQLLDMTLTDFESSSADEVHTYLSMMKTELSNANILLEDLLTWAKSQFNAVSFNPVEIKDLSALIDKCVQNVLPMAVKKQIAIVQSLGQNFVLYADSGMLETIIRNLLSNAVKFTEVGGTILVRAESDDKSIKFSVQDNGVGIPPHKVNEMFNKNSNYTTYGTAGEKGTGLGLSLCYDFVSKHNGKIWVESEKGIGTTFYFTIPELLEV
uniref:PAS domain S-box protein n=1 Tax=Pedobacter schmidteae TaxID=2201271 RepID=UPI000EB0D4A6|nr:PAS domain S-box protein [Pedobacter schmidteae]